MVREHYRRMAGSLIFGKTAYVLAEHSRLVQAATGEAYVCTVFSITYPQAAHS